MNSNKFLQVAALFALLCGTTSFAETLTVDAGGPVAAGATAVPVNIIIDNGANTAGASFTVTYDATKLVYRGVSSLFFSTFAAQGISPDSVTVDSQEYTQGLVANPSSGSVMLAAAQSANGASGSQTLFTLSFDVASGATGTAAVGITQSTITNAAAGYSTPTQIPMLIGISGSTYPEVTVTNITSDTLTILSGITDTDGDQIDDTWEITHFGNLTTANATSDFDRDGYTDKQEYLNGGSYDPKTINAPNGPGFVSISPDSLVINFSGFGLYTYNSAASFTNLTAFDAPLAVAVDIDADGKDEIVAYLSGYGIYVCDNGSWSGPIASLEPETMTKVGNRLVIDFGEGYGLYTYNTAESFTWLTPINPSVMTEVDIDADGLMELVVTFPGAGIYVWDNGNWSGPLTAFTPETLTKVGNRLVIDFGEGYGLYTYNTAEGFTWLTQNNPGVMTEADIDADGLMELVVTFPGFGIYVWDNGNWSGPITAFTPETLTKVGNRLVLDFGEGYGLYTYNTTESFTWLTPINPSIMTEVDVDADGLMELAVSFPDHGIYIWDNGNWIAPAITPYTSEMITSGNLQ